MPPAIKQLLYLGERDSRARLFHNKPSLRNFQAQELISLAILPLARLEKTHQNAPLLLIAQTLEHLDNIFSPCRFHPLSVISPKLPLSPETRKFGDSIEIAAAGDIPAATAISKIFR